MSCALWMRPLQSCHLDSRHIQYLQKEVLEKIFDSEVIGLAVSFSLGKVLHNHQ